MGIWDEFDGSVNREDIDKALENGGRNYPELPRGRYEVVFEGIEATVSKKGKPMLKITARVTRGEYKKSKIFMYKLLLSDKGGEATANMIASAVSWLKRLEAEDADGDLIPVEFRGMAQFAALVGDIDEALGEMQMRYSIMYDPDAYDRITIEEVAE